MNLFSILATMKDDIRNVIGNLNRLVTMMLLELLKQLEISSIIRDTAGRFRPMIGMQQQTNYSRWRVIGVF